MLSDTVSTNSAAWTRLTSLARIIDPRLPSHRLALAVATGSALLAAATIDGGSFFGNAFNGGVGSFLAWAIARELDPDRPNAAALSGALAGGSIALLGPALLLPLAAILVTARILHRSTGLPLTVFDLVSLLGVAYLAGTSTVGWAASLALAFAVARDHRLPNPAPRRQLFAAFALAAVATGSAVIAGEIAAWEVPDGAATAVLAIGVFAGLTLRIYSPTSRTDFTGERVDVKRLQSARRGVLGAGLLAFALSGGFAVAALSPLWATLAGVGIWDRFGPDRVDRV